MGVEAVLCTAVALPPLFPPEELDLDGGALTDVPFFSFCSFLRAFLSAHQIVIDWLRFSLLTRGFRREPDADAVSSV
jgi:hypothetical protein